MSHPMSLNILILRDYHNGLSFQQLGATKKKNIRRSWTISNPSGTLGPQIPVRRVNSGDPELKSYAKVDVSIIHDDLTPKVAPPPVFMSVPQAPIHYRGARSLRGNVPIRSQSMSQADSDRFFANGARVMSRHRNDQYRRPSQSYEESSSENDEGPPSLDRRKQRRTTSTARPHPSHSLPRPPKRVSEHEDRRTVREPTPDYDDSVISSEAKESLRMKPIILGKNYYGSSEVEDTDVSSVYSISSFRDLTGIPEEDETLENPIWSHNNYSDIYFIDFSCFSGRRHSLTEKKYFKLEEEEHDRKSSRIEDITLSDLESTRVDDYGSLAGDPEDDDILICSDKKKPPEGNDFKLVFISSCDSSKESEINPTDQQPYRKSKKQKDSAPEIPPKRNKLIRSIRDDSLLSDSERIALLSSPSVSTIRTSNATKDPASPLNGSPGRVPKTIKQKEFLRVSLLADVTSIVPTSPNRSLSESDLSEVQDYLLGSSPYLPIAWNEEEEEEKKETGRISGTGGPPLPPKTRRQREPKSSSLLETFVDEQTRPSKRLARSYSNVGSDLNRLRPVRRSKSYKGSKKKHAPHEQEENKEDVIITRQGANFVRIQIGPRLSATPDLHHTSVERKYSLEELEVEEVLVIEKVEDEEVFALIKTSDTEGDFLDKDPNNNHHHNRKVVNQKELLKRLDLKRKELSLLLNGSVESISKDSKSVVSDVDSVSTTSASYTIHHSDEDELDEKKSTRSVHSYNRRNEEEERMNLSMNKRPGKTSSIDDTCAPATPPASTTTSIPSSLSTSSVLNPDLPKHETAPKVSDLIAKFEQNKSVVVPSKSLSNISNKSNGHHLEEDEEETRSLDKNFEGDYDDEDLPLGAEASSVSQSQRDIVSTAIISENSARESSTSPPPMAPTVRRNSNGAYTSYVFISSNPNEDSVASAPSDRVTVHSGGSCVMTVQDGRSSNISIVSTESSDLGSPTNESEVEPNYDSPPDVPSKTTLRPTVQDIPDLQRSRGGEPLNVPSVGDADDLDSFDPNVQDGDDECDLLFIRSARRVENDIIENNCDQEDEESTHQDESRHHQASEEEEEEASFGEEELYSDDYDVDYDDQENFMDYPMCQPVYDDSDYSESDLLSSGDEDFGESCEDSESDCNSTSHHHSHYPPKRQSDPSELEKYFYYGVGGGEDHHDSCESSFSEEETNHRIIENVSDGSGSDCFSNNSRSKKSISQKAIEERENSSGATEEEDDIAGDAVTNESLSSDKFPLPINPIVGRIEDQRTEVSSPPVNGPVRKHKSRDSGFVGSCDDLLRNDSSSLPHLNTDSAPSLPSDDGTTDGSIKYISSSPRFERLSEIHEQPREENEDIKVLSKDNWNSDDEPVLMMNKMKDFFRSMLPDNSHPSSSRVNPDEEAREETLSRLMKSVPSLEEEQVKEIVERLGDEKTWTASSDSYLNDEEEILFSKMNRMSTDRRISESAMRQLSSRLILLMKETDSSKKKWRRSWSMSSENDSSLPKLTLLPTEAKIRHTTNSLPSSRNEFNTKEQNSF
ncbi:SYTL [Lepeophtheirus salmonis]|uniref:SYTL n=1 Tax=Lepeophtheirus salmonis TaxID=72036 RepID=A0A7R8D642_LEPSM|nr:SYTL [Lepeophtheirus salmonis]CAF3041535.1 SYTL [Lepeophtheirus salmonis]